MSFPPKDFEKEFKEAGYSLVQLNVANWKPFVWLNDCIL